MNRRTFIKIAGSTLFALGVLPVSRIFTNQNRKAEKLSFETGGIELLGRWGGCAGPGHQEDCDVSAEDGLQELGHRLS